MTGSEIAVRGSGVPTAADMQASVRYAEHLAHSGLLPANYRKQPANVLYAIEYGRMVGLTPMAAITGVHVIEGKPSASAALISALVRRAGHKLRVRGDARSAFCQIIRSDDPDFPFEVTYTIEDARGAKLTNKEVWQKYPAAMLKARAISQCARDACEEALFGLHYTPEELGASVDDEGLPVITVEQAAEKMRRNQPHTPAEDDWSTSPDAAPTEARPSTHGQRTKLVLLVKDKRGIVDDMQRRALLGELAGHAIASSKELTFTEAHRLIDALEAEPDHIADAEVIEEPTATGPNPRNGDTGKPLDPALFVPSLQSLLIDSRGKGGPSVADSLAALIAKASEPTTLEAIWRVAAEANMGEHITADQFKRLNEQGNAKNAELSGPVSQPSDAPTAKQYEAADKLAKRIRQTGQLDALNSVHGTLTEARDGGSITAIQFATLERQMDDRYQVLAKAAGIEPDGAQAGHGWSHRLLNEMAGTAT